MFALLAGASLTRTARADDAAAPTVEQIRGAVERSLPLLERGAKGSMEQRRQCFTCHNQGIPLFALTAARERGFPVEAGHIESQLQFIAGFLAKNREKYQSGKGTGGQVDTAGYALWTLQHGGWQPDEATAAVAHYLLVTQSDRAFWKCSSRRPPSEQSSFTTTFVALQGLANFSMPDQRSRVEERRATAREWVLSTPAQDHEDRVFRLRVLKVLDCDGQPLEEAVDALRNSQRDDGGWAQLDDAETDAYATGTALVALHEAGDIPTGDPAWQRGLAYLLKAQLEDGSWHVVTRSDPFQEYFESGYPHGDDQYISIAAAGWATRALILALPRSAAPSQASDTDSVPASP